MQILMALIGLAGCCALLIAEATLAGPAAKTGFTPWMTLAWLALWWGPLAVKFAYWLITTLAKIWWAGVTEV